MVDLNKIRQQSKELESVLRLQSLPLALKLLRNEDEIPEGAEKPVENMGCHLSFCQALALARRHGRTIAQTKSDMWCFEPVVGLGFAEPPQPFLDGHNKYPGDVSTLEAGATWARNMPRLDYGMYSAVVCGPLQSVCFEPDILMVYGDPAKMTQIMQAKNWLDGRDITVTLSSHAACVYYVVPSIREKKWNISLPCGGDLRRAACEDYNMVFSGPIHILGDLLRGLKGVCEAGIGLPLRVTPAIEYPLQQSYVEIGRLTGMDWLK